MLSHALNRSKINTFLLLALLLAAAGCVLWYAVESQAQEAVLQTFNTDMG